MRIWRRFAARAALFLGACQAVSTHAPVRAEPPAEILRVATFNVSLSGARQGELAERLAGGRLTKARAVAEVIQRVRPDVLLINEIDCDADGRTVRMFTDEYLRKSQNGQPDIEFPWVFTTDVNTGVPTGVDLEENGRADDPGDCFGFGRYPGQYGMAVLSQIPIQQAAARTFQMFLWKDMPDAKWPIDPRTGRAFYRPESRDLLRLSSKSHWDVPLDWQGVTLHFLVSHPTPPVFDGPEDRNGCRNFDEIRFWADYIDAEQSAYIMDDRGHPGGLPPSALFVIAGDLNADPLDGESHSGAIDQLLRHSRINAANTPASEGARSAAKQQAKRNRSHRGDPQHDTADFGDDGVGNLRVDYVLPNRDLQVRSSGVFWPLPGEPAADAARLASDHRLVWIELQK